MRQDKLRQTGLFLLIVLTAVASSAQTSAKPTLTTTHSAAMSSGIKLPAGVPPAHGILKTAFALRYQDITIGSGAEAEPNKIYKVHYTGWLAADGRKIDSSYERRNPILDKDGRPVMGEDGKPKMGDPHPEPFSFPQGYGRLIPGWDQGFAGMKIGGKRRLFIPWQLAYGAQGRPGPDADHPGVPAKADLIFDVELLDVTDLPTQPNRPGMAGGMPRPGAAPGKPAAPATPAQSASPATPAQTGTPAQPATTSQPQQK
jgi:peptidylprolyl isomerase